MSGQVPGNRSAMKQLGQGYQSFTKEMMKQFVPQLKQAGVLKADQSERDIDLTNLSDIMQTLQKKGMGMVAANINTVLGNATGLQVGELEQKFKADAEFGKTSKDRIDEIQKKMAATANDSAEYVRLQRNLMVVQTDQYTDAFSEFQKEMKKNGGDVGKIVAASNTQNKEKADYVGDGTNDQNAINAAIAALPAGGGSVVLLDGTYNLTGSVNIAKSNVVLTGSGASTNLKRMWQTVGTPTNLVTIGDGGVSPPMPHPCPTDSRHPFSPFAPVRFAAAARCRAIAGGVAVPCRPSCHAPAPLPCRLGLSCRAAGGVGWGGMGLPCRRSGKPPLPPHMPPPRAAALLYRTVKGFDK